MQGYIPDPPPTYNMPFGFAGNLGFQYMLGATHGTSFGPRHQPIAYGGMNPVQGYLNNQFYQNYQADMFRAGQLGAGYLGSAMTGLLYEAGINPSPNARAGIGRLASMMTGIGSQFSTSIPMIHNVFDALMPGTGSNPTVQAALIQQGRSMRDPVTGRMGWSGMTQTSMLQGLAHGLSMPNDPGILGAVYSNPFQSMTGTEVARGIAEIRQMGFAGDRALQRALNDPTAVRRARRKPADQRNSMEQSLVELSDLGINSRDDYDRFQQDYSRMEANLYAARAPISLDLQSEAEDTAKRFRERARNRYQSSDLSSEERASRMQSDEADLSVMEYAERVLSLGASFGGDMAFKKGTMATEYREALEALRSGDMTRLRSTSIGRMLAQADSIGDATDLLTGSLAESISGVSAAELHRMALTSDTSEINAAGAKNQGDLFGVKAYEEMMSELEANAPAAAGIRQAEENALRDKIIPHMRTINAINDLLATPEYREFAQNLPNRLAAIDTLSGRQVSHQMTPDATRRMARQLEYASARLGIGPQEFAQMSQMAGQIGDQYGMQAAMTPELALSGVYYNQTFMNMQDDRVGIYGSASAAQLATQAVHLEARGMKSFYGRRAGAISSLLEQAEASGTPEGKRLAEQIRAARDGDANALQSYMDMDRSELIGSLAQATGLSERILSTTIDNELVAEEQMFRHAGLRSANREYQQREVVNEILGVAGADGVRRSLANTGLTGTQIERVGGLLTAAFSEQGMESGKFNRAAFASAGLTRLEAAAAGGDEGARAFLNNLRQRTGGDRDAMLKQLELQQVHGYDVAVSGTRGAPTDDIFAQFGDPAIEDAISNRATAQASGYLAEIMSGENKAGIAGVIDSLRKSGETGGVEGLLGLIGAAQGVDFTGDGKEIANSAVQQLTAIKQEAEARRKEINEGGYSLEERRSMTAQLEKELSNQIGSVLGSMYEDAGNAGVRDQLRDQILNYQAEAEQESPAGAVASAAGAAGAASIGNITLSNAVVTLNGRAVLVDGEGEVNSDDSGSVEDAGTL